MQRRRIHWPNENDEQKKLHYFDLFVQLQGNGAGNGERRRKQGLPAGRIVMSAAGIMDLVESRDESVFFPAAFFGHKSANHFLFAAAAASEQGWRWSFMLRAGFMFQGARCYKAHLHRFTHP